MLLVNKHLTLNRTIQGQNLMKAAGYVFECFCLVKSIFETVHCLIAAVLLNVLRVDYFKYIHITFVAGAV